MKHWFNEDKSIRMYNGDCLEVMDKMIEAGIKVDCVITSPPYFGLRNYTNSDYEIGKEPRFEDYIEVMMEFVSKCHKVLQSNGTLCLNIGDKRQGGLNLINYRLAIRIIDETGFKLINDLTWCKLNPTPMPHKKFLTHSTEPIFIFSKGTKYTFKKDEFMNNNMDKKTKKTTIVESSKYFEMISKSELTDAEKENATFALKMAISKKNSGEISDFRMKIRGLHSLAFGGGNGGRNNQIKNNGFTIIEMKGGSIKKDYIETPVAITKDIDHTAVYPECIPENLINLLTNDGDMVFDPFSGSGTTGVVSKRLNRKFIGIELSEKYFDISVERIKGE